MGITRILSIDGGGIRGIIPASVLVVVEELLKKHSGRVDAKIADYFDLIAGTSTGGILATIYLYPSNIQKNQAKFSAEEALKFYLENGPTIFEKSFSHTLISIFGLVGSKYSNKGLVSVLEAYYKDLKLQDLIKPCLITSYNVEKNCTTFFNQLDTLNRAAKNFLVKDIIRATTAAPSYFPIAEVSALDGSMGYFIDGGVFANNPTLCAYAEASKLSNQDGSSKELLILSLGTGNKELAYNYKKMSDWGLVRWIEPIFSISRSGVSEVVDYQLRIMYQEAHKMKDYLRIQVDFDESQKKLSKLDNVSPSNMKELERIGTEIAQNYYKELDELTKRLVQASSPNEFKTSPIVRNILR